MSREHLRVIDGGNESTPQEEQSMLTMLTYGDIVVRSMNTVLGSLDESLNDYRHGTNTDSESVGDARDRVGDTAKRHKMHEVTGATPEQLKGGNLRIHPTVAIRIDEEKARQEELRRSSRLSNFVSWALRAGEKDEQ